MSEDLYLVTGASGFVGSHVVQHLVEKRVHVRAMVRDSAKASDLEALGVEIATADLKDAAAMRRAVEGVHGVFHIAASFRQAGVPDAEYHQVNVEGTRRLIEVSIDAGVRRFIHCSTVGVHGDVKNPPATESAPIAPGDIYQRSKLAGERIALEHFRDRQLPGVVIRPAMIYGPGDKRTLRLFRMISRRRFFYVGSGNCLVHFVDVRDLARAFHLAMQKEEISGEVYIIAGNRALSLRELSSLIARQLGVPVPWLHVPVQPMQWLGSVCEAVCKPMGIDPPIYRRRVDFFTKTRSFDSSKARRDLGFEPAQDVNAEVADIINSYRVLGWL